MLFPHFPYSLYFLHHQKMLRLSEDFHSLLRLPLLLLQPWRPDLLRPDRLQGHHYEPSLFRSGQRQEHHPDSGRFLSARTPLHYSDSGQPALRHFLPHPCRMHPDQLFHPHRFRQSRSPPHRFRQCCFPPHCYSLYHYSLSPPHRGFPLHPRWPSRSGRC